MTDEGKRKPPPRFPRPVPDAELVRVTEDDAPDTQRGVAPPVEPVRRFDLHKGRNPSFVEIAAALSATQQQLSGMAASQTAILDVTRKLGLQADGLARVVNERFNIFHTELALLRVAVTEDGKRIAAVEKTLGEKAKAVSFLAGKGATLVFVGGVVSQLWPQYAHFISGLMHTFGLQ